jgi:hypothetical protein
LPLSISISTVATVLLSEAVPVTVIVPLTVAPFAGEVNAPVGAVESGGAAAATPAMTSASSAATAKNGHRARLGKT